MRTWFSWGVLPGRIWIMKEEGGWRRGGAAESVWPRFLSFCSAPTSTGTLPLNTATPTRDLISQRFFTSDTTHQPNWWVWPNFERNIRKITSGFKKLVFLYPLFLFLNISALNRIVNYYRSFWENNFHQNTFSKGRCYHNHKSAIVYVRLYFI